MLPAWLVRYVTYPAHEACRGRPTMREYRALRQLALLAPDLVQQEVTLRLGRLLLFAQEHIPYYRDLFRRHTLDLRAADPGQELRKLPVLKKADVRANAGQLIWPGVSGGLLPHSSGGTSGDTLHFWIDRVRQAQDLAARLFMQSRFGVQPGERRLHLWGSPIEQRGQWLKRLRDRFLNERLLDAFELAPAQMDAHLRRVRRVQPRVIYGYPTALALLARHTARTCGPADFPWLRLIVLTGEEVTPDQIDQIRRTFGCPTASEYGNREVGLIAHDCPHGQMHVIAPHVLVEIVDDGRPVPDGACGDIVCTTLKTRAQPFIRYRLGDVGRRLAASCTCGLALPLMRLEGGKVTGCIALPSGHLCHGSVTSHVLRDLSGIVEFKTIQHHVSELEVLLVVDQSFNTGNIARIQQRYEALFGADLRVTCRILKQIPPEQSGKRRYVVSHVAASISGAALVDSQPRLQAVEDLE